jgi:hypothetical protein
MLVEAFVVFLTLPPGICQDNTLKQTKTASFQIFGYSFFIIISFNTAWHTSSVGKTMLLYNAKMNFC